MTGKQLKNSILQWAIQGKLVPQDPNDEPASVLLEKIRAEKTRLVKEGKIKRDKKESIIYRGEDNSYYEKFADGKVVCIDDEISFEIPESWVWVRLEDISFVGTGSTPDRTNKEYYTGSIPWVNSSLTQNDYILQTPEFISEKAIEETSCRIYPIGTLIVAMYGQGKTRGQVSELKIAAATNQACAAIQVYNCDIKTFVKLFFKYNYTTIRRKASGGAQPNLNLLKIKKIVLPLPPLAEQKRIVAKIEELMPILHKYDKAQKVLDELNGAMPVRLRQSILQEAIQGKLIPQDPNDEPASVLLDKIRAEKVRLVKEGKLKKKDIIDSIIFKGDDNKYYEQTGSEITCIDDIIPFDLPASWCWVRHNQLFEVSGGSQPPKSHFIDHYKEGYIRLYQIRDYGSNPVPVYVPIDEISKTTRKGDILLARYGGSLGKVFWAEEGAYNVAMAKVIPLYKSESIYNEYIFLYYCSSIYQSTIIDHSRSAQAGFNKDDLADMLFPLPPFAEQVRIVERYKSIVASIMSR